MPHWPEALDGLRVAVAADLHAGMPQVRPPELRRVARMVARTRPDLVLFLGDFVEDEAPIAEDVPPERVGPALTGLDAPLGVFGVLGNHDWGYGGIRVREAMERAGIRILENESVRLGELTLAVVGDEASGRADVAAALEGAAEPVIVATHSPDIFPSIPERVSLTLAGHTHGGQLNVPLLRRIWVPSRFGARYADPVIEERGRLLFVHPGIGTSKLPLRLGAAPEVALLVLRASRERRPGG